MSKSYLKTASLGLLAVFFTVFGPAPADAAKLTWHEDLRKASAEASRLQKPMLLEFTASWCGYCHKMFRHTFTNERIVEHINGCFIPVKVDADAHKNLMEAVGVEGLPTTVIISPDLKVITKITGYQTAEQLEKHLQKICVPSRKKRTAVTASIGNPKANRPPANRPPQDRRTASRPPISPRPAARAVERPQQTKFAFGGHCLVGIQDKKDLLSGNPKYAATHRGKTVCFSTAEHKRLFESDSDRYWPVAGGACVVTAVSKNQIRIGDPEYALLYRGRLWFFVDAKSQNVFYADPEDFICKLR